MNVPEIKVQSILYVYQTTYFNYGTTTFYFKLDQVFYWVMQIDEEKIIW